MALIWPILVRHVREANDGTLTRFGDAYRATASKVTLRSLRGLKAGGCITIERDLSPGW